MRGLTALTAALLLTAQVLTPTARALEPLPEDTFSLPCTAAVLMERESGALLYAKNEYQHLAPASVTKVMTLLLVTEAVESGSVKAEDTVTASRRAASMGGSQVWLEEGERMSVAEMVKCVAVVSANDCAVALAEHLAGSEEAFTARMNERARELGLQNTHFANCTGLFESEEHYTCAYDLAVMSRELLSHAFIRPYTALWMDSIRDGAFGLTNTNKLLRFYPGCTGLKTGFTTRAMFCLAASAEREGTEFIAVILHADTSQERFDAARTLLDYGFANYESVTPAVGELPRLAVTLGAKESVGLCCPSLGKLLLKKGQSGALNVRAELPESVSAPVEEGQRLGLLRLWVGEECVAELPLLALEAVERRSFGDIWLSLVRTLCGAQA